MIEPLLIKATAPAAALVGLVAVIDPSITSIALAVIAAAVVIIPLWFTYKTNAMNTKLKEKTDALNEALKEHDVKIEQVTKASNGMKDELVRITDLAGIAKGVAKEKADAAVIASAAIISKELGVQEEKNRQTNPQQT